MTAAHPRTPFQCECPPGLNPAKCQALQICLKTDVPYPTELKINGCSFNFVDHAKLLGVWLWHDLSWDKNISEMIFKTNRRLYMLRMLKRFGFKKDELITVYTGYIRPLSEYADVVWNSSLTLKGGCGVGPWLVLVSFKRVVEWVALIRFLFGVYHH